MPREVLRVSFLDIVASSTTETFITLIAQGGVSGLPGDPLPKLRELITLASLTYGLAYSYGLKLQLEIARGPG